MPQISVIVPVYKVEPYLRRCVDSILHQTYTDFELILVDDGSPDGCPALCDEYTAQDSRVRVIHKPNGGVSNARNAGLDTARGQYITFIDGDDFCDSGWIKALYEKMAETGADIVSGDYEKVDEGGAFLERRIHCVDTKTLQSEKAVWEHILHDILSGAWGWETWSRLFRAEVIQKNHLRFCETCGNFAEDQCFVMECALFCTKVSATAIQGYKYVQRNGSMMHKSVNVVKLDSKNELSRHFIATYKRAFPTADSRIFPVMHYLAMRGQYRCVQWNMPEQLETELHKIRDRDWYTAQTEMLRTAKPLLRKCVGWPEAATALAFSELCLQGQSKRLWRKYKAWRIFQKRVSDLRCFLARHRK